MEQRQAFNAAAEHCLVVVVVVVAIVLLLYVVVDVVVVSRNNAHELVYLIHFAAFHEPRAHFVCLFAIPHHTHKIMQSNLARILVPLFCISSSITYKLMSLHPRSPLLYISS